MPNTRRNGRKWTWLHYAAALDNFRTSRLHLQLLCISTGHCIRWSFYSKCKLPCGNMKYTFQFLVLLPFLIDQSAVRLPLWSWSTVKGNAHGLVFRNSFGTMWWSGSLTCFMRPAEFGCSHLIEHFIFIFSHVPGADKCGQSVRAEAFWFAGFSSVVAAQWSAKTLKPPA